MKKFLRNKRVQIIAVAALKTLLLISTFLVVLISFYGFSFQPYIIRLGLFDFTEGFLSLKMPLLFFSITLILGLVSSIFIFRTIRISRKAKKQNKKTGGILGTAYLSFGLWLIAFAGYFSYVFLNNLNEVQEKIYAFVFYMILALGAFGILVIIDYLNSVRLIRALRYRLDIDQFGKAISHSKR